MKVLVCGGRNFRDQQTLNTTLSGLHKQTEISTIIEGGAKGADSLAREWARQRKIPVSTFYARWLTYGISAGPRRNLQMLNEGKPDLVVAFEGGKGTANMIEQAERRGVKVIRVYA